MNKTEQELLSVASTLADVLSQIVNEKEIHIDPNIALKAAIFNKCVKTGLNVGFAYDNYFIAKVSSPEWSYVYADGTKQGMCNLEKHLGYFSTLAEVYAAISNYELRNKA